MLQLYDPLAALLLHGMVLADDHEFTKVVHGVNRACRWFNHPYMPSVLDTDASYAAALDKHCASLLDWGKFIETNNLPAKLLKSNLHMVCCRLKQQCLTRGHSGSEIELYIERMILNLKYHIRDRVNQRPEKVMVNNLLLHLGVEEFGVKNDC